MITPRRTRLLRVANLHAFRRAIADQCGPTDRQSGDRPAIVVPTRGAGRQLLQTIGSQYGDPAAADAVTRDELYDRLHGRLPEPPRRLTAFERDTIAQASAAHAANELGRPFQLRAGLVVQMLRFYDQLRRQLQRTERFEELIEAALGSNAAEGDRGAHRMLQQTRFLATTFREYERRVAGTGAVDEHLLRDGLLLTAADAPLQHVIVTLADWIADPDGLFVADFDLLARLPDLATVDIVCTEGVLASGFHERLHNWLPGIEEVRADPLAAPTRPVIVAPPNAPVDRPWFTVRDREEELVTVCRRIDAQRRDGQAVPLHRIAVVFKRPLPYLYAARETFGAAGIPYQASDALPLAAEPTAAAVDLVLDLVETSFSREAIVALLRSPHFVFAADAATSREPAAALNRVLSRERYLGDLAFLEALSGVVRDAVASGALTAVLSFTRELAPLAEPASASQQLERLQRFMQRYMVPLEKDDLSSTREGRARAAMGGLLDSLRFAQAVHHDPMWTIEDLAPTLRRWIEEETFVAEGVEDGVHLLDDQAARYGEFDEIALVGLIEKEWPEAPRRNIFYPSSLLNALGWPSEKDRRSAADAMFLDVLQSASTRVSLSTITLDDEALVTRSLQLDEVGRAGLSVTPDDSDAFGPVFFDDQLIVDVPHLERLTGGAREWAEMRIDRPSGTMPQYHGSTGPHPARQWSVSALETYLSCPFKFFAQHVLTLDEEPDDEEVMDPRRQGLFVHAVFEEFFRAWQSAGHLAITPGNLDSARTLFEEVVDEQLKTLPGAEAGIERTRLLGSSAAAGLGEAVLRMEAERPTAVVERLLEHRLSGEAIIATAAGPRTVSLRGKADRLDLLADGTFRVIDYKLGWPPNRGRALQLPIYAVCAQQQLSGHRGRTWTLGEAAYLAFKGPRRVVPLFSTDADRDKVLGDAQQRLSDTLDAIERGEFPPTPDDVWRCETCSFAGVCRKDYVGDV